MNENQVKFYPLEPHVRMGDYRFLHQTTWHDIDQKASTLMGRECLGIPSVRVGMCWTLEYLGYSRHRDHVFVPKFMGRCILNSLNRYALPVEVLTPETRATIVVHQYGLKQHLELIAEECASKGLLYIEDSPYGLELEEELGPSCLAKFIGLCKILPVLKGALMISNDLSLLAFIKHKRKEASKWSWAVLSTMAFLRRQPQTGSYSALADLAYEMYLLCKGDNIWLRGNIFRGLEQLNFLASQAGQRLSLIKDQMTGQILVPDTERITYVVPYFPKANLVQAQKVFRLNGFDSTSYHVDVARNLFSPHYEKALLVPLNPRIPFTQFQTLINALGALSSTDSSLRSE